MKKFLRMKLFWAAATIAAVLVVGLIFKFSGDSEAEYDTAIAQVGKLVQTVTATGVVESADEIDLNFSVAGRLTQLAVKEGDRVTAGQVLAAIDSASLSARVVQNRANVTAAQAELDRIKSGASIEEIAVSAEKVAKKENDLNNLLAARDNELQTLREKSLNAINNAAFTATVGLDTIYSNLIYNNTISSLIFNDANLNNEVQIDYWQVKNQLSQAQTAIATANSEKTNDPIIAASADLATVLADLNSLLDDAFSLAEKIVLNNVYTQSKKDEIKSDLTAQQSTNNTSLTSLQTAKANLINSVSSYVSSVQAAENDLTVAQAELNLVKADPRGFEVSAAEAKVVQARAQLNQILAELRDYRLVAPIDGTITEVNFNLGEQTSVATPAIKLLSVEKFEIKADIPESDIAKIKVGDTAIIELDAFGADHLFAGRIGFINPAQTLISDVTYYRVTITLESNDWTERIKPGMSADAVITTAEKDNVVYIPQRAVKVREAVLGEVAEKYVEVLVGDEVTEKPVEVGLRGDNGLVEVISGLVAGEQVITFKKENNR